MSTASARQARTARPAGGHRLDRRGPGGVHHRSSVLPAIGTLGSHPSGVRGGRRPRDGVGADRGAKRRLRGRSVDRPQEPAGTLGVGALVGCVLGWSQRGSPVDRWRWSGAGWATLVTAGGGAAGHRHQRRAGRTSPLGLGGRCGSSAGAALCVLVLLPTRAWLQRGGAMTQTVTPVRDTSEPMWLGVGYECSVRSSSWWGLTIAARLVWLQTAQADTYRAIAQQVRPTSLQCRRSRATSWIGPARSSRAATSY